MSTEAGFDLDRAWCLDDRVAVRPEPFGALLYHYVNIGGGEPTLTPKEPHA